MCVRGEYRHEPPVVFPGYWAMALQILRRGTDGLAHHTVSHVSFKYSQKIKLFKQEDELFTAKSKTRNACWTVPLLGTLGDQSAQLLAAIKTMKEKKIELLALAYSSL